MRALRGVLAFALCAAALVALFCVAVNVGTLKVDPQRLFRGLFVAYDDAVATIFDLRFPRAVIAMVAGGSIAVSGVLLQAAVKNPLADPGIIGISAAASLAAVLVLALAPSLFFWTPLFACGGGALAFVVVYALSWQGGLSPLRIILVGVSVSVLCQGLSQMLNAATGSSLAGVASLVQGSITLKTWSDVHTLCCYAPPALVASVALARRADLLALDDKQARSIGMNVDTARLAVSAVAVALSSLSTSIVGPISFLGLVVPHIARILVGSAHRLLVPFSMLLGAFALLLADTLGRTVAAPHEISAAIVMSVCGGPVFVVLLRRARQTYGA